MSRPIRAGTSVDVSAAVGGASRCLALTVALDEDAVADPAVLAFFLPGGGYNRTYFDMHDGAVPGGSQLDFHTAHGWICVACDPLGVGESQVTDAADLTFATLAAATAAAVQRVVAGLADGSLLPETGPRRVSALLGVGHSMGGLQVIKQQGTHHTWDAIAVLGHSAIQTAIPSRIPPPGARRVAGDDGGYTYYDAVPPIDELKWAFHWDDVAAELVDRDLGAGFPPPPGAVPPWASTTVPGDIVHALEADVVGREAESIRCPVLVMAGERDVIPALRAEPAKYRSSGDIRVVRVPGIAHMYNFSAQRGLFWAHLHAWAQTVLNPSTAPP